MDVYVGYMFYLYPFIKLILSQRDKKKKRNIFEQNYKIHKKINNKFVFYAISPIQTK